MNTQASHSTLETRPQAVLRPQSQTQQMAYLGIVLTTFFWGSNFNVGAYIIQHLTPLAAAAERFVIASTLLLVIFGFMGRLRMTVLRQNVYVFIAIGILSVVGFNTAMFFGLHTTTPVNGALIMATTPLSTLALAIVFEGERLTVHKVIGLLIGLFGVVLVVTHGQLMHLAGLKVAIGDLIILGGSLSWSASTIVSRRFVRASTPLETTAFSMLFGTLGLVALSVIFEHPLTSIASAPPLTHVAILYLSVFGSMLAYLLWFNGIQQVGSSRATAFFNLVPVFAMLVSMIFGVLPNPGQIFGTLCVVFGVVFTTGMLPSIGNIWRPHHHPPKTTP